MSEKESNWHALGPAETFTCGTVRPARVAGTLLAVGRSDEGLFAVDGLCPHEGTALGRGTLEGTSLTCPRHGFVFDVRTGRCHEPADYSVGVREVRVVDGVVQIRIATHPSTT